MNLKWFALVLRIILVFLINNYLRNVCLRLTGYFLQLEEKKMKPRLSRRWLNAKISLIKLWTI
jgi:hypothetical protein